MTKNYALLDMWLESRKYKKAGDTVIGNCAKKWIPYKT